MGGSIYNTRRFFREFFTSTTCIGMVVAIILSIFYNQRTGKYTTPTYIGIEEATIKSQSMSSGRVKYQMGLRSSVIYHWLYPYGFKAELSSGDTIWVNTPRVAGVRIDMPIKVKVYRCYRFEGCKVYQHIIEQGGKAWQGSKYRPLYEP